VKNIKWLLVFCCAVLFAGCMGYVNRPYLPGYDGKIPTVKSVELGNIAFNDMLWLEGNTIYLLNQPNNKKKKDEAYAVDVQSGNIRTLDENETEEVITLKKTIKTFEKITDTSSVVSKAARTTASLFGAIAGIGSTTHEKGKGCISSVDFGTKREFSYKIISNHKWEQLQDPWKAGSCQQEMYISIGEKTFVFGLKGIGINSESVLRDTWHLSPDGKYLIFFNRVFYIEEPKKKPVVLSGGGMDRSLWAPNPGWSKIAFIKMSFGGKQTLMITDFDVTKL
jgi:hypothetical protein